MKKKDETITSDSLVNNIDVYSVKKYFPEYRSAVHNEVN